MSFDEMYDEMLHAEFRTGQAAGASSSGAESSEPVTGFARYRTATLVGVGGVACATAGALLGGLGGYFTLSPASAHTVTDSSSQVPLTSAADTAFRAVTKVAPAKVAKVAKVTEAVSKVSVSNQAGGSVVNHPATATPIPSLPVPVLTPVNFVPTPSTPVTTAPPTNTTTTKPATPVQKAVTVISDGLSGVMKNLNASLAAITSLPANPLVGMVSDITITFSDLSSMMPLPISTATLPVLSAAAPAAAAPAATPAAAPAAHSAAPAAKAAPATSPSTAVKALTPVVQSVAAAATGSTSAGVPAIPSLPLQSTPGQIASLPVVSTVTGALPALPVISLPAATTTDSTSGTAGTCVSTPALPTSPLPTIVKGTIAVGPIAVKTAVGGPATEATVCVS